MKIRYRKKTVFFKLKKKTINSSIIHLYTKANWSSFDSSVVKFSISDYISANFTLESSSVITILL